ncbi:Tyrosine-protein kinase receptor Tie-1 [Holothuria leucospilota]|uniref:Tyrosine-protein kinase receptor Tie-1 n=1 Tax=Holothuria leucospilota TaxID=206669 RepID=A0A9Q1BSX2_HOLLE|nr:Tyrosine-protein kinase receptor Tie-1 [Holothuria leucospilota]
MPQGNGTYLDVDIAGNAIDFDFLPSEQLFLFINESFLFSWDPKTNEIAGPFVDFSDSEFNIHSIKVDQSRSQIYLQLDNTADEKWQFAKLDGLNATVEFASITRSKGGSSASFVLKLEQDNIVVATEAGIEKALLLKTQSFQLIYSGSAIEIPVGSQVTAMSSPPGDPTFYYSLDQQQGRIFCYNILQEAACPINNIKHVPGGDIGTIGFYDDYFFPSVVVRPMGASTAIEFWLYNISTGIFAELQFKPFDSQIETSINIAEFHFICSVQSAWHAPESTRVWRDAVRLDCDVSSRAYSRQAEVSYPWPGYLGKYPIVLCENMAAKQTAHTEGPSLLRQDMESQDEDGNDEVNVLIRPAAIRFKNSKPVVLHREFPDGFDVSFRRSAFTGNARGITFDVDRTRASVVLNALGRNPRDAIGVYAHDFQRSDLHNVETITSVLQWAGKLRFTDATITVFQSERLVLSTPLKRGRGRRWVFNGKLLRRWNRMPSLTIPNVMEQNEGIYEIFLVRRRFRAAHGIIRVIVADCPENRFNAPSCDETTSLKCYNRGILRSDREECICAPGFMGEECETPYGSGFYGQRGQFECPEESCSGVMICLPDPYGCSCAAGYHGPNCDLPCRATTYGASCRGECHCGVNGRGACDPYTGKCLRNQKCNVEWTGHYYAKPNSKYNYKALQNIFTFGNKLLGT